MNLTQEVVILSVSRYDFQDDNGKQVKGTTVWYFDKNGISEPDKVGCPPVKASLPVEAFDVLSRATFPANGIAQITVDLTKNKLKVTAFEFKK